MPEVPHKEAPTQYNSMLIQNLCNTIAASLKGAGDFTSQCALTSRRLIDKNNQVVINPETAGEDIATLLDSSSFGGAGNGLGSLRVAQVLFDPVGNGQTAIDDHGLGITLPDNALVVGGFLDIIETFTSAADSATVAISIQTANDILSAVAISSGTSLDAGRKAIIPKVNTPESTSIKLTANREVTASVAVQVLTAGKANIYLYYVQGL